MVSLSSLLALLLAMIWVSPACCTVQLQPVNRLAAFQANGSFVLNSPRTVAAGTDVKSTSINVLQRSKGTWALADVVTPPEPALADFVPGSVLLSTDGRLLAVAAAPTAAAQASQPREVTVGYVFKIVAQPHSHQAFRYRLVGRLTLPANNRPSFSSSSSSSTSSWSSTGVSTGIDMSADGQTLLACWAHRPGQASALPSPSTAAGAQLSRLSGAAAVFTWNGYGQSLHALQLPVPQGSKSFGQACQLSEDGRTALVLDASRGAMMYSREAHTPRGAAAAYRAAGWLAGAPGRQQYRVAAAGLGADGRQAALLVQGGSTSDATAVSNATLKVFAANSFGQWSDVCSIPLAVAPSRAGVLKLAASDAGVHVWATLDGALAMFAVGLDGGRPAHCPVQPAASTVLPPRQPAPAAEAQPQAVLGPGVHARTVRIGRLTVSSGDAEATYTSLE